MNSRRLTDRIASAALSQGDSIAAGEDQGRGSPQCNISTQLMTGWGQKEKRARFGLMSASAGSGHSRDEEGYLIVAALALTVAGYLREHKTVT